MGSLPKVRLGAVPPAATAPLALALALPSSCWSQGQRGAHGVFPTEEAHVQGSVCVCV